MYPNYSRRHYEFMGYVFQVYRDGKYYATHESSFSDGIDLLNRYDRRNDGHIYSIMTAVEAQEYEGIRA